MKKDGFVTFAEKDGLSGRNIWLRGLENHVYQIEEAVVSDRFLLAVAEHREVREKNYFFFAAAFFAGAFFAALAAFFFATVALLTGAFGRSSCSLG